MSGRPGSFDRSRYRRPSRHRDFLKRSSSIDVERFACIVRSALYELAAGRRAIGAAVRFPFDTLAVMQGSRIELYMCAHG